jgi:hypothetical protein
MDTEKNVEIEETIPENVAECNDKAAAEPEEACEACTEEVTEDICVEETSESEICEEQTESVAEEPVEEEKPKRKKKRCGVFAHIGATIFSIILVLAMILTVALAIFRITVSPGTFEDMFKRIEITELKVTEFIPKEELESYGIVCESDNLIDIVYDNIDQSEFEVPVTKEQLIEVVEDEAFQEFFGTTLSDSMNALLEGNLGDVISIEKVVGFVDENREQISELTQTDITDDTITEIETTLQTEFGEVFEEIKTIKVESVVGEAPVMLLNILFADWLMYAAVGVCILIGLLIMLMLRSFNVGSRYFGVVTFLVGAMYLAGAIVAIDMIMPLLGDGTAVLVIEKLAPVIVTKTIILSSALVAFGIIFPVALGLICRTHDKKRT